MSSYQHPASNSGNLSKGDSGIRQQRQQQIHTPASMTLAPSNTNSNKALTAAATMSPLHIGLVEGLTEQQTAEMVELLTPFLSPASTPALNSHMLRRPDEPRAFSPLTSPALIPHAAMNSGPFSPTLFGGGSAAEQYRAQQQQMAYQQQQSSTDFVSMPPPSPSITAEHIMRRQQQQQQMMMQQHSPSFPSVSAATLSPYLPAGMGGGGGIGRRRGSTSTGTASGPVVAQASSSHSLGSSQYHPYRGSAQQQQRQPNGGSIMRSPLPNSHQANQSQLVYTPSLLSRGAGAADADDFFLDSLPTSATSPRIAGGQTQQARNRTLHQLNASPSFASSIFGNGSVPPAPQRSVSLNSAALAMLSSNGMEAMQTDDDPMITAEQFNSWIEDSSRPPATAPIALRDQQQSATPASLMNLPLSAHHLPHSVNGEIVSSEGSSQSPATASAIVSAFGRQQIGTAGPSPAAGPMNPIGTMSASLLQFVTQSAPMTEFVHPPLPPPLHIGPSESVLGGRRSASAEDNSAQPAPESNGRRTRRKSVTAGAKPVAAAKNPRAKRESGTLSSAAGRRRSRTSLLSPRQTPLVPSTLKNVSSPGFSPHSMASPGLAPLTPATLAPRRIASSQATPNMGPMTSGSVTPQMRPRAVIAATSTTNIVGLEADIVTRLATKSNYQNIMEGNSEFLGLKYKTEFKSGLERRRTNHKQAEQKRRDSLKTCFQALKNRLPDLDPKLVSKIYLLNRANAFIDSLTRMNDLLVAAATEQGIDVAAIAAQAQAADPGASYDDEDDMSNDDDEDNDMDVTK
ncbi:hypothetical protein GGI14_001746 [Coemansia sp. S680]|nr:hypothetical protein GGI14_001746 [Coemansia sp. S680]